MTTLDHDEALALVTRYCRGRPDTRAAKALYDDTIALDAVANDPRSCVASSARAVLALHRAGAITQYRAEKALGALLAAYREVRDLP